MARTNMNELLRKRMAATQQASEQQTGDAAYERIFQMPVQRTETQFCDVPVDKLRPFFTADIGFHPYPHAKLEAFAEELKENGLYERILVRPIAGTDEFEILAGHNRTAAAKLAGWTDIPATVMTVNDQRAISIAIATNLLRRQDLTIIERGKAYKALLDARNRCGQRNAAVETFGDNRQRYNARKIVAEFFGVTEYEIRKAVKLAQLILPLAEIVENEPKKLNLACADLIADYDKSAQTAFIEMCQIDGYALNKQTMAFIQAQCPPPSADQQAIYVAWREAREKATSRAAAPPKKLSFDRKRFAPYLSKFKSDEEIEELKKDFVAVEKQVSLFEKVDTQGVEPMVYPFETPTVFLREDVVSDVLTQEEALKNVKDARMGHVHVPKVVK